VIRTAYILCAKGPGPFLIRNVFFCALGRITLASSARSLYRPAVPLGDIAESDHQ
jgi:hypothetical protein